MGAIFGVVGYEGNDIRRIENVLISELAFRSNHPFNIARINDAIFGAGGWLGTDYYIGDNKNYIIVCEGEIYNCLELFNRFFADKKHLLYEEKFSIIRLLYERFGISFPQYLNGVFCIALWDINNKILYLVRDHVGSHSLYYSVTANGVFFSTTINSLLATGAVSSKLSPASINQYFASKALSPPATMYISIASVRASHVTVIKGGVVIDHDYWNLHNIDVNLKVTEDYFVEQLHETIIDAVGIRASYPGHYGAIVSGGLDSGIVAALLAKKKNQKVVKAFSVAFDEGCFSDAPLQKLLIKQLSFDHHQEVLGPDAFAQLLIDAIGFLDSPVNDIAFVGMAKVFELAKRNGVDVVFEGEGPDEIFPAGNSHGERQLHKFLVLPGIVRHKVLGNIFNTMPLGDSVFHKVARFLTRIGMDNDERRLTWRTYFHNKLREQLISKDWYDASDPYVHQRQYLKQCTNTDTINRYQFGLIKTFLADDLLFKDERMASSKGVMNRVPLIDYRLVELALKIPSWMQLSKPDKSHDGIKCLYKRALRGHLPEEIISHKKIRGFSHPTSLWYRDELKEFVLDILLGSTTRQRGIFNTKFVEKIVDAHLSGKVNLDYPINSLLIFELWMRRNYDLSDKGRGID